MLKSGTSLGSFEIRALIGRGGMGEVYRARDTRLHRDVAIKVLPEAFTSHPARLERLEREARVLASLNHPNIASIYGLEENGAIRGLVLELIDGPTLADRLMQGPVPVEEALRLALQIAQALEAAHQRGVIHRDLKPSNIKLTADGQVKVLDFGLAKAFSPSQNDPLTGAASPTETGGIVGTPAYMSPEQARGDAIGFQTDIWSFGTVLYELLTGTSPFLQGSTPETLVCVLDRQPDFAALPPDTPIVVRRLIRRCLEKDPRRRLQHIGDARLEIEEAIANPGSDAVASPTLPVAALSRRWPWLVALTATALATGFASGIAWHRSSPRAAHGIVRASLPFLEAPEGEPFGITYTAISPDGTQIAYASVNRLWVRAVDQPNPVAVGPTVMDPFFSPDGQWIGAFTPGGVVKVPISGGQLTLIAPSSDRPAGGAWREDGTIAFATSEGLFHGSATGGAIKLLIKPDRRLKESLYAWPQFLPGGRSLVFTIVSSDPAVQPRLAVLDLDTLKVRALMPGSSARYVPTGHLVFVSGTTLKAIAFDASVGEVRGNAVSIPDVEIVSRVDNGAAPFAISDNGTLLVAPSSRERSLSYLEWIDRHGKEERLPVEASTYNYPRISPDGTRVAFERFARGNRDIWILDLKRLTQTQVTDGPTEDMLPMWAPDGQRVWFASNRTGNHEIYSQAADGASDARLELASPGFQVPNSFTPDARTLAVYDQFRDVGVVHLDRPDRQLEPLLHSEFDERLAQISPDGKWVLYESDESGTQFEIMLRSFPDVRTRREKISINGGRYPHWGPKGSNEVYYVNLDGGMMAASVTLAPALKLGPVTKLFDWQKPPTGRSGALYDISPLDGRFIVTKPMTIDPGGPTNVSIVMNWFDQLRRLTAAK